VDITQQEENRMIYLDNAATTMVDESVVHKMMEVLGGADFFGNPNSSHALGKKSKDLVEESRLHVANMINAEPEEIYFTSGGTESNNWAIYSSTVTSKKCFVLTSAIEHHSVHVGAKLFNRGVGVISRYVPVDPTGFIDIDFFEGHINSHHGLATVMMANNEIGTVQPIKDLVSIAHYKDVLFHTDAVQAMGKIQVDVKDLDVDMMSISSHKIHGPKGVGALYIKKGVERYALLGGGHQEGGFRSGTYNVPGIVGMGEAARLINSKEVMKDIREKENKLWKGLKSSIPNIERNGDKNISVPGIVNVCFNNVEGKDAVLKLSERGVCCSSGSACNEGMTSPSHVLKSIGLSTRKAHSSIRFSLSRMNLEEDIDKAIPIIADVIKSCREIY
jgi:cysteine desulfurase